MLDSFTILFTKILKCIQNQDPKNVKLLAIAFDPILRDMNPRFCKIFVLNSRSFQQLRT
ncbi:hypothetical protein GIB67_031174, partial [Kingdonia uniflora]